MFKNLIHRIPKIHHHPHPGPCNFEPREPGERYPKEPELTDYWLKPYLLEALKQYPKLNDDCVVQGLWRFVNSIILHNPNISVRKPPTFDDPVTTHKISFTDKDDIELGAITFWRKVDSTFGIDMKLKGRGLSIVGNNDEATQIQVDDPIPGGSGKQVVNMDYLGDFTEELQDAIDDVLDRVRALEKVAKDTEPLYKDPNGNLRQVHTTIHNDPDDSAFATCYSIYQYGQAILQAAKAFAQNYIVDPITLHQYPHEDDTDKLVSCAGVYKYGQDILTAAQDYCDEHQSGGGSGGGGDDDSGSADSVINTGSTTLYYAKNADLGSSDNDVESEDAIGSQYPHGGTLYKLCQLNDGDIILAKNLYRTYGISNHTVGEDYEGYATSSDVTLIDPITTDSSIKYKVVSQRVVYSGNKDNWSKTTESVPVYGCEIYAHGASTGGQTAGYPPGTYVKPIGTCKLVKVQG